MEFRDLYKLSIKVTLIELLIKEEAQRKTSSSGTYYQEYQDLNLELEVDATEVTGRTPFT